MSSSDNTRPFTALLFGGGFSLTTVIIGVCLIVVGVKYGESLPGDRS